MRFLLINPGVLDAEGRYLPSGQEIWPGLTLPYLAALIPPRHELRLVDDCVETVDFATPADVVLLTAMHSRADRAYQIADRFRANGRRVVMGGLHVSQFPEEALQHVDAVVIGEGEAVMEDLIRDLEAGRLQPIYRAPGHPDLSDLPIPRYDLLNPRNYLIPSYPVQTSRGCPFNCRFCYVPQALGRRYRHRPIPDVLRDLSRAGKFVLFVDDNLMADRDYALELFQAMKKMGKLCFAQGNIKIAEDLKLLAAARQAGVTALYTGIETLDPAALQSVCKNVNLNVDLGEAVAVLNAHRLTVCASMILGFDSDTEATAEAMLAFLEKHRVALLFLFILVALPGPELWREMEATGRLRPVPWYQLDGTHANFEPKNFTREQLESLFWRTLERFYATRSILKRISFPPRVSFTLLNFIAQRKLTRRLHPLAGFPADLGLPRLKPLFQWVWERSDPEHPR